MNEANRIDDNDSFASAPFSWKCRSCLLRGEINLQENRHDKQVLTASNLSDDMTSSACERSACERSDGETVAGTRYMHHRKESAMFTYRHEDLRFERLSFEGFDSVGVTLPEVGGWERSFFRKTITTSILPWRSNPSDPSSRNDSNPEK